MTASRFRHVSGLAIVGSHVFLIVCGFILLLGNMETSKIIATLLILVPVFGVFASQVVNNLVNNPPQAVDAEVVSSFYIQTFFLLFGGHIVFVLVAIYIYAYTTKIPSTDLLQQLIGIAESAFGFLVGMLVTRTFGAPPAPNQNRQAAPRNTGQ